MTEYLTRAQAAAYLTQRGFLITKGSLQKMATVGGGPVYRRFGIRTVYSPSDLDEWAESKLSPPRRSTSDEAAQLAEAS
jgi:hypothetical protein